MPIAIGLRVVVVALCACSRRDPDATKPTRASQGGVGAAADPSKGEAASATVEYVRVAVVIAKTVKHLRSVFTKAGIETTAEKIVAPEGSPRSFPPESYVIAVPADAKAKAISLIREDAPKGRYWIQTGPLLDALGKSRNTR